MVSDGLQVVFKTFFDGCPHNALFSFHQSLQGCWAQLSPSPLLESVTQCPLNPSGSQNNTVRRFHVHPQYIPYQPVSSSDCGNAVRKHNLGHCCFSYICPQRNIVSSAVHSSGIFYVFLTARIVTKSKCISHSVHQDSKHANLLQKRPSGLPSPPTSIR